MDPNQQQLFLTGGASKKKYIDEVFSVDRYQGTGNGITITNGIDLATEGGSIWSKNLTSDSTDWIICDTDRGTNNFLSCNHQAIVAGNGPQGFNSYNTDGFNVNNNNYLSVNNTSNNFYCPTTFRKAKGFFTTVKYTGNGDATRDVPHDLGCVPGFFTAHGTTTSTNWNSWHRESNVNNISGSAADNTLNMNSSGSAGSGVWNNTNPTATHFSVDNTWNVDGTEYIFYLWAGGEDPAARSVKFNGTNQYLSTPVDDDFEFGTGDFTIECWAKFNGGFPSYAAIMGNWTNGSATSNGWVLETVGAGSQSEINWYFNTENGTQSSITGYKLQGMVWNHIAVTQRNQKIYLYVNGKHKGNPITPDSGIRKGTDDMTIGGNVAGGGYWEGWISNIKITKGQALYTGNFAVDSATLTTTSQGSTASNVKLLCCNGATPTTTTVSPGAWDDHNGPVSVTHNPFIDPAGSDWGEEGDKAVIKCGAYMGNGNNDENATSAPIVNLGWEPQWVLIKRLGSGDWNWIDVLRNMPSPNVSKTADNYTKLIRTNSSSMQKEATWTSVGVRNTGFIPMTSDNGLNENGSKYVYVAIRREDGVVAKPPEVGTDAFNTVVASASGGYNASGIPDASARPTDFDVDGAIMKQPTQNTDWLFGARKVNERIVKTSQPDSDNNNQYWNWNFTSGMNSYESNNTTWNAWMWKRGPGFDVCEWRGEGTDSLQISHNMGQIPEMIWTKNMNDSDNWICYHYGLNGGVTPWNYFIKLNSADPEGASTGSWNETAPTATDFTVGDADNLNWNAHHVIAYLFASVEGICKCGVYDGNGETGSSGPFQSLTFTPRLIMTKHTSGSGSWFWYDSVRGWGTFGANHPQASLNNNSVTNGSTCYEVSANGFRVVDDSPQVNGDGEKYIYYAHA